MKEGDLQVCAVPTLVGQDAEIITHRASTLLHVQKPTSGSVRWVIVEATRAASVAKDLDCRENRERFVKRDVLEFKFPQ